MTEVTWATIGGIASVIIAQILRWALSRTSVKQSVRRDLYKEIDQLWDKVHDLEKQVDVERTARVAVELENMALRKELIVLKDGIHESKH